jgi:hypothetical protein
MSGGSWNYAYRAVEEMSESLSRSDVAERRAFGALLAKVGKAMYAIEWVDSCDWKRGDEMDPIRTALGDHAAALVLDAAATTLSEYIARARATLAKYTPPAAPTSMTIMDSVATDTAKEIAEIARRRVELIMTNREKLCEAFIAETGLKPSECELVEDTSDPYRTVLSIRPRTPRTIAIEEVQISDREALAEDIQRLVEGPMRPPSRYDIADGLLALGYRKVVEVVQ